MQSQPVEQLRLGRDRSGVVHAVHEPFSVNEFANTHDPYEAVCEDRHYFEEVFGQPLTCLICVVNVQFYEHELGIQWRQRPIIGP